MTAAASRLLKKYTAIAGSLILFFAAFFGLVYLRKKVESTYVTAAAQKLCSMYQQASSQHIRILGIDPLDSAVFPSRTVLSASYAGHKALVFMLPVTGKYGVYTAVFLYERTIGCRFCGLAGINILPEQALYYGITPALITIQQNKIITLMKRQATHGT